MNILNFLWRWASQNLKVGKYENLGQFFMFLFKNWTASDDPTKTAADMLWYIERIIKSYFQDWLNEHISREIHLFYVVEVSLKYEIVSFFTDSFWIFHYFKKKQPHQQHPLQLHFLMKNWSIYFSQVFKIQPIVDYL